MGQLQIIQPSRIGTFLLTQWIYLVADKMDKYYRKLVKNYFNSIPFSNASITSLSKEPAPIEKNDPPVAPATKATRHSTRRNEIK